MNMKIQFSNTHKNCCLSAKSNKIHSTGILRWWPRPQPLLPLPLPLLLLLGVVVCFSSVMLLEVESVLAAPVPASSVADSEGNRGNSAINPAVENKYIPFQHQPTGSNGGESEKEEDQIDRIVQKILNGLSDANKQFGEFYRGASPTARQWIQRTFAVAIHSSREAYKRAQTTGDWREIVRVVAPKLLKAAAEIPADVLADVVDALPQSIVEFADKFLTEWDQDDTDEIAAAFSPTARQWIKRTIIAVIHSSREAAWTALVTGDKKEIVRVVWRKLFAAAAEMPPEIVAELVDKLDLPTF